MFIKSTFLLFSLFLLISGCSSTFYSENNQYAISQKNSRLICSGDYFISDGKVTDSKTELFKDYFTNQSNDSLEQSAEFLNMKNKFEEHILCLFTSFFATYNISVELKESEYLKIREQIQKSIAKMNYDDALMKSI